MGNGATYEQALTSIDANVQSQDNHYSRLSQDLEATPTATLTEPFNDLSLASPPPTNFGSGTRRDRSKRGPTQDNDYIAKGRTSMSNKQKRTRKHRNKKLPHSNPQRPGVSPVQPLPPYGHAVPSKGGKPNSNGWRETLILEEEVSPLTDSRPPPKTVGKAGAQNSYLEPPIGSSLPRRSKKRQSREQAGSGWATEDATDAHDLPEFDFAHNLSKFDKRGVFDKLKQEDTTADEDRLVSQNKASRKLRYDENVLGNGANDDSNLQADGAGSGGWAAGESELSMEEGNMGSGRERKDTLSGNNGTSQPHTSTRGAKAISSADPKSSVDPATIHQTQQRDLAQHADRPVFGSTSMFLQETGPRMNVNVPTSGKRSDRINPTDVRRLHQRKQTQIIRTPTQSTFGSPSFFSKDKAQRPLTTQQGSTSEVNTPAERSTPTFIGPTIKSPLQAANTTAADEIPQDLTKNTSSTSAKPRQLSSSTAKKETQPFFYFPARRGRRQYGGRIYGGAPAQLCPTITALQALELEQIAIKEFALTEDMLAENAGRSIAQIVVQHVLTMDYSGKTNSVMILAGNHRTGARAIAAARHLVNRGNIDVWLYIPGLNDREKLIEGVLEQLETFKACAKPGIDHVFDYKDIHVHWRNQTDALVDALLGIHNTPDDLPPTNSPSHKEILEKVPSEYIDQYLEGFHTGYSYILEKFAGSQKETNKEDSTVYVPIDNIFPECFPDSSRLPMSSTKIVALSAPKTELLATLSESNLIIYPDVYLADIGIPQRAWPKLGLSKCKDGITFGGHWVRGLGFEDAGGDDDDGLSEDGPKK